MKVILLKDLKDIGHADTVVNTSDGHARNYLFPNKLAVPANDANLAALDRRIKEREAQIEKDKAALREIASKINGKEVKIDVDAGESGKLFGSVTSSDIAAKIHETLAVDIDKRKIHIDEPIKTTGNFRVQVKFSADIIAKLNVIVASKA